MENIYTEYLKKLSILYVEDEESAREGLKFILHNKVRKIFLAENGQVGLEKYIKYNPDIVITDIKMPFMDGIEMVKEIKKISPHSKIVYVTAHTEVDTILKAIDAGADQYIPKPISKQNLFFSLAKTTKMIMQERELNKKNMLIQLILDSQDNIVVLETVGETLLCNRSTLEFLSLKSFEEFKDKYKSISDLFIHDEPYLYQEDGSDWIQKALDITYQQEVLLYDNLRGENREFAIKVSPFVIEDENMKYVITLTDVTELNTQNNKNKDALTQVYNRNHIKTVLDNFLLYYKNKQKHFSIIIFSITNLKELNAKYNEDDIDDILVDITIKIKALLNKHFFVGRLNGGEFIVLAPLVDKERAISIGENINQILSSTDKITYSIKISQYNNEDNASTFITNCKDGQNIIF